MCTRLQGRVQDFLSGVAQGGGAIISQGGPGGRNFIRIQHSNRSLEILDRIEQHNLILLNNTSDSLLI